MLNKEILTQANAIKKSGLKKTQAMPVSLTLAFLGLLLLKPQPLQAFGLSLLGGSAHSGAIINPANLVKTNTQNIGLGVGVSLDTMLWPGFGMDWGIFYMPRGYDLKLSTGGSDKLSFSSLQIPLIFRFYFIPAISIGLGFYASGNLSTSPLLSSAGTKLNGLDYGIIGNAQLRSKLLGPLFLVADVRYLSGLANLSQKIGEVLTLSDLQLLLGIRLGTW